MKFQYSLLLILLFSIDYAYSGSCCGGGGGSAQIMLGPTKSVFRASYQNQTILADSNSNSKIVAKSEKEIETIKTTTLSSSYKLNDLWQAGITIPVVEKVKKTESEYISEQGLGDISLNTAYEFWPEYSRNQFITQSFLIFQITLPTSPSLFTSQKKDLLDTRGQGHNIYSLGSMTVKRINNHTINFGVTLSYREGRTFNNTLFTEDSITTESSLNNELSLSHSYAINNKLSSLVQISRTYEQVNATSVFAGNTQSSLVYTSSLGMIYSMDEWDINLLYKDDMLIGPSFNHTLSKALSAGIIKRINL